MPARDDLTIIDHFVLAILPGIVETGGEADHYAHNIATMAYLVADELVLERDKRMSGPPGPPTPPGP